MATLDWNLTRSEGVTLVELVVTSETMRRVRIESALSPVWPPRRRGVPVPAWDGDAVEGVVEPSAPLVVGYASPAEPVEPPATITDAPPEEESVSPRTLVRALGDATPPRDAVGPPATANDTCRTGGGEAVDSADDGHGDEPTGFEWGPDRLRESPAGAQSTQRSRADDTDPADQPTDAESSLEGLQHRLSVLEDRLETIETATAQSK
jgi:hypothetical protein